MARYQLDYILVTVRYRNSVKSAYAYPGADGDTLVMMKSKVQLIHLAYREKNPEGDETEKN